MSDHKVFVVGSANRDYILRVDRNPQEGETVLSDYREASMGGKASNRGVALARMGTPVYLCCNLGDDDDAVALREAYKRENIDTRYVFTSKEAGTGTAYILLDRNGKNSIVNYMGANNAYTEDNLSSIAKAMETEKFRFLSLELEITMTTVEQVAFEAKRHDLPIILDAGPVRPVSEELFRGVFLLSPNEAETKGFTGIDIQSMTDAKAACDSLYAKGAQNVLIKLGKDGAIYYAGKEYIHFPSCPVPGDKVVDTTGAGDCFMGALTHALVNDMPFTDAIPYANCAGAIAVSRIGAQASMPKGQEVDELYGRVKEKIVGKRV